MRASVFAAALLVAAVGTGAAPAREANGVGAQHRKFKALGQHESGNKGTAHKAAFEKQFRQHRAFVRATHPLSVH